MNLSKHELSLMRHAMYLHRELVRAQYRIAMNEPTDSSSRDMERYDRIITESLKLDEKLSDAINSAQPATTEGAI